MYGPRITTTFPASNGLGAGVSSQPTNNCNSPCQNLQRFTLSPLYCYVSRSFGCDAPVGTVYSINPAMIMTLVPLVGAAATHYSHFDMIHYGSYVSALSPLWMAAFTTGKRADLAVTCLQTADAFKAEKAYVQMLIAQMAQGLVGECAFSTTKVVVTGGACTHCSTVMLEIFLFKLSSLVNLEQLGNSSCTCTSPPTHNELAERPYMCHS